MAQNLILLPVFAQVLLTFAVLVVLGRRRRRSMAIRMQTIQDMALARDADWEGPALLAANNFKNQFELPVLFYAGTAFALVTCNVDMAMFLLAWIFVLSRLVHAAVHLGSNVIMWRGSAYLVGFAALVGLWGLLAVRVIWSGI
ncbi:MAG: MAPEG family protein [Hyphomicrobiaceae bacterium]